MPAACARSRVRRSRPVAASAERWTHVRYASVRAATGRAWVADARPWVADARPWVADAMGVRSPMHGLGSHSFFSADPSAHRTALGNFLAELERRLPASA